MNYGIYFAYSEKEWNADQKKYIEKVKNQDLMYLNCLV